VGVILVVGGVPGGVLLVWGNVVCPGWLVRGNLDGWVGQWYGVV